MRFLLIEDEPSAVHLTKELLGHCASRIDDTATLSRGLALARENTYDVVILDLRLLDSDRNETIASIPKVKALTQAPVVVCTGWPDPNMKERCLAAGADAFVNKNEMLSTILMAVHVALEHAPAKEREPSFAEHVNMLNRLVGIA